jgi:hypothetical protein
MLTFFVRDMVESFLLTASRANSLPEFDELLVIARGLGVSLGGPDLSLASAVGLSSHGAECALVLDLELAV